MGDQEKESVSFEDTENFRAAAGEKTDIKSIVMRQFNNCINEGSKEITLGGYIQRFVNGRLIEVPVPDQAEIFIRNVLMLLTIIKPFSEKHDNLIQKEVSDYYTNEKKYIEAFTQEKERIIGASQQSKFISRTQKNRASPNEKLRDLTARLAQRRVENARQLLDAISTLLNKINYLEESGMTWG